MWRSTCASGPAIVFRSRFSAAADGIHISASNVRIEQTLVDGLLVHPGSHNDAVQLLGAPSQVTITKSKILNAHAQTSCLYLLGRNITISRNYLSGGGWTLYAGANNNGHGGDPGGKVIVSDNIFGREFFPKGGHFGPVAYWDRERAEPSAWLEQSLQRRRRNQALRCRLPTVPRAPPPARCCARDSPDKSRRR